MRTAIAFPAALLFLASASLAAPDARDLNGDGAIDLADAKAFLARVTAGGGAFDARLDCNRDGKLDLSDALLFGQWVNGLWGDSAAFPTLIYGAPEDRALFAAYGKDKASRAGLTLADLQKAYPARAVPGDLAYGADTVEYVARLDSALATLSPAGSANASAGFSGRVLKSGMAVYGAGEFKNFESALDFVHTQDLPLLFTTDALLNTLYRSYDNILMALEENSLVPALGRILASAQAEAERAHAGRDYAQPVSDYFQAARNLLSGAWTEADLGPKGHPFGRAVAIDWTQFKPRGHYTRSPRLQGYFRAMMWLSRADLALQIGGPLGDTPKEKSVLMKKASLAIWDAVVNSGSYPAWRDMNAVISFMVGKSDGLAIDGMGKLAQSLGNTSIRSFLGSFNEARFDKAVAAGDFGMQTILSNVSLDTLPQERIFAFMPQRFILDSYTFSEIVNGGQQPLPLMPSSLDIAFMLGDNSALADQPSANAQVLAAQRRLYDGLSPAGYRESLYGMWIDFLRKLNGAEDNAKLSPVFRTLAWRKKMRNTQLYSWAHLRHNTILYAKQSYTGTITCSHPHAYVEPYPDFYHAVGDYARKGAGMFRTRDAQVTSYFDRLAEISGRLEDVARVIAAGGEPTDDQVAWLRNCISSDHKMNAGYGGTYGYKLYNGWYFDLIYTASPSSPLKVDDGSEPSYATIADVHTKPADERDPRNLVLHAATGRVNLMAAVIRLKDCTSVFVGPTGTYYDVTTDSTTFERLSDEEWESMLNKKDARVKPPAWTQLFRY